jgi:hypothetical protein
MRKLPTLLATAAEGPVPLDVPPGQRVRIW